MPFSTGATWPSLTNRTASAADVNAKFEWLEGHRYPNNSGTLQNNTWDVGSTSHLWNVGVFSNIVLDGNTLGADVPGKTLSAWATVDSDTATSFNVSSFSYMFFITTTSAKCQINFATAMASDRYVVCAASDCNVTLATQTTGYCQIITPEHVTGSSMISVMVKQ